MMTIKSIKKALSEGCNELYFTYNGKKSGIEPLSAENGVITFEMWHGDKIKKCAGLDKTLNDKFFSGKSITELIGIIDFSYC